MPWVVAVWGRGMWGCLPPPELASPGALCVRCVLGRSLACQSLALWLPEPGRAFIALPSR